MLQLQKKLFGSGHDYTIFGYTVTVFETSQLMALAFNLKFSMEAPVKVVG